MEKGLLKAAIEDYGIKYGIIGQTFSRIAKGKNYFCSYLIAVGTPPIHGKDGIVTDHFLRTQEIRLQEDERGMVDYKNLNLFEDIEKGDIVYAITEITLNHSRIFIQETTAKCNVYYAENHLVLGTF